MNTFVEDFKRIWNKPNNVLEKLIIINVVVFVIISVIEAFSNSIFYHEYIFKNLALSSSLSELIFKPWTLFTYFFTHERFFHILFNMLFLYWFGILFNEYLGYRKLLQLYILGGLIGGIAYLLIYNILPYFFGSKPNMIGASAGVYAIVVGTATLVPNYRMFLLLIGPVKIKYIAAISIFLSVINTAGSNAGGNIAHLGGALIGFLFITNLKQNNQWGKFIKDKFYSFNKLFKKSNKLKVSYKREQKKEEVVEEDILVSDQKTIDTILDKISESGYKKLTKQEKQILFEASKKKE